MKKILFAMMACVAMFAFAACSKTNSQIFDLDYDETTGDQAEKAAYEINYKGIFIEELSKVSTPVTEAQTTFKIDDKASTAQKTMKAAFQTAGAKAQAKAGDNSIMKGFKVLLKYNEAGEEKNQEIIDSFTFK